MRFEILTIFPGIFDSFLKEGLLNKAIEKGVVGVAVHDIRRFSENRHQKTDDAPFGGGAGMVMTPQPLADAIDHIKKDGPARTILLSPRGAPLTQQKARELAREPRIVLVCGRYEGVDERIAAHFVDEELSVGDFVLNGGEVAAMAVVEAVFRLIPGVVGAPESLEHESHEQGLLECPQYTRPEDFRGLRVPEVLLSGNHANIERWRREESLAKTAAVRPDMLEKYAWGLPRPEFSLALVHAPVAGRGGHEMVASITTLDVHDMARHARTFGARRAYIVTPVADQKLLVERIREHWLSDGFPEVASGRRTGVVELISAADTVEDAVADARKRAKRVKVLATTAQRLPRSVSPAEWRTVAGEADEWIILFGTAWGLGKSLMERADRVLAPIEGDGEFNHLPVRGASAIILDRLFARGRKE